MSDIVAVGDGEVLVAEFLVLKGFGDVLRDGGEAVGVGGLDIDLLDLGGAGDLVEGIDIHNEGVVKIDIVEVNGGAGFF